MCFSDDPLDHFVGLPNELLVVERSFERSASRRHGDQKLFPFGLDHGFALLNARGIVMTATRDGRRERVDGFSLK